MGTSPPPTSQRALADYAGVQGLWTILEPAVRDPFQTHMLMQMTHSQARPVKLEALAKKRLAVDASIWIYQVSMHYDNHPLLTAVPQSRPGQGGPSPAQLAHRRLLPPNLQASLLRHKTRLCL